MNLLVSNLNIAVGVISLIELGFIVLFLKQFLKDRKAETMCMLLVVVGLFVDAALIALGAAKPEGISENVSRIRYIAHGALIPLMFPICGYALGLKSKGMKILWAVTALIMIVGVAQGFAIKLELAQLGNTIRHVAADDTPLWAEKVRRLLSFGAVLPVIAVGVAVWIKQKRPYFFLAGFLMFVFSAVGPATGNFDLIFFFSMLGEVCICIFFYLNQTTTIK